MRRRLLVVILAALFALLGGVSFSPVAYEYLPAFPAVAKMVGAVAGVVTAIMFAYSDTRPTSPDREKLKRQRWRRDRAKLFTHGAVIGLALFVLAGAFWQVF